MNNETTKAPIPAYSSTTLQEYPSLEDLLAAETAGYSVVIMMRYTASKTGREQYYSRVFGVFENKRLAKNKAAALRRDWKKRIKTDGDSRNIELLSVSIEPIWTT